MYKNRNTKDEDMNFLGHFYTTGFTCIKNECLCNVMLFLPNSQVSAESGYSKIRRGGITSHKNILEYKCI